MTEAAAYPPPPVPPQTINITASAVSSNPGVPPAPSRDPLAAVMLEIVPAICLQTFGIGNIYAGNVLVGVLIMFAYWFALLVNIALCFILIGFLTGPLTFLAFGLGSSYLAYQKAKSTQPRPA